MNKFLDTKEFLKLQETDNGYILFINNDPQKVVIKNGVIKNKLTKKQLEFVQDYL